MITSTSMKGKRSRIVPLLRDTAVVIPRGDVQYVVSEYGAVNLFGKSLQERALAMISIAHPSFRDELFYEAKKMGLLSAERTLKDSIHGVYPVKLEEILNVDQEQVTIRPAKPDDERRIQEHFYNLAKDDVVARFFHERTSFLQDEAQKISQIDYVQNLTLVAVVGEIGFEQVVAIAEYLLEPAKNMAEIAFSVTREFQGKGLGRVLIKKLSEAAREHGIGGLFAYTSPQNRAMVELFKTLPYTVQTVFEGDTLVLSCRFEELNKT